MFKGYERTQDTYATLADVIKDAMYVYPEMRLGQIIANAIYFCCGQIDLFDIRDEMLIEALKTYTEQRWSQREGA